MFLTAYNNKGEIDVANFDQFANLHQARVRDEGREGRKEKREGESLSSICLNYNSQLPLESTL